jgi:hypothetical protein
MRIALFVTVLSFGAVISSPIGAQSMSVKAQPVRCYPASSTDRSTSLVKSSFAMCWDKTITARQLELIKVARDEGIKECRSKTLAFGHVVGTDRINYMTRCLNERLTRDGLAPFTSAVDQVDMQYDALSINAD